FLVSCGWGTYGFKAAPIVGSTRAGLVATGRTPDLIAPFALERRYGDRLVSELAAGAVSHWCGLKRLRAVPPPERGGVRRGRLRREGLPSVRPRRGAGQRSSRRASRRTPRRDLRRARGRGGPGRCRRTRQRLSSEVSSCRDLCPLSRFIFPAERRQPVSSGRQRPRGTPRGGAAA